ncbi:arabinan endo-1,5-alpha-L-arabinosidase [Microbacterium sp. NPDC019599]|uniref:arabinan endo-1,5-alpha-L-arabinosidase n=1 Tax=Microbacterium sp. NPDC019599 TaxID=3154690 RepID=UPI0033FD58D0
MPRRETRALLALLVAAALGVSTVACAPASPAAQEVALSGDLGVHDPALVVGAEGEPWYVFSTGDVRKGLGAPQIRRSLDEGATWEYLGTVWDAASRPEWAYEAVPGVSNFWAPDVVLHDGVYYLYYSVSTFGKNTSAIGLTTNTTLDPDDPAYEWVDQGLVWKSTAGQDNYNAIDPGVITDEDGTPWMAFGSFWGGIQLLELDWPSGMPAPGAEPTTIASRIGAPNAIEAPYLVRHDGHYYLFVSEESCCKGTDSTYRIAVGRSERVTGPYVGPDGTELLSDGAQVILDTTGDMVGPGGQSVSHGMLGFHFYDATQGGLPQLAIRQLAWDEDGWPVARIAEELAERPAE